MNTTSRETVAIRRTSKGAYSARAAIINDDADYSTGGYAYIVEPDTEGFWLVIKTTQTA